MRVSCHRRDERVHERRARADCHERIHVRGVVAERGQVELAPQFAVDAAEEVQVEGRRDADRVVVRRVEHRAVLDQVHTDQQAAVVAGVGVQAAQEHLGLFRRKITDRRAG